MFIDAHPQIFASPPLFFNRELIMNYNYTTIEPISGGFYKANQTGYGVVCTKLPLRHVYGGADNIPATVYYLANYCEDGANVDYHHHPLLQNVYRSPSAAAGAPPFSFQVGQDFDIFSSLIKRLQHGFKRIISLINDRARSEYEQERIRLAKKVREEWDGIGKVVKILGDKNQTLLDLVQTKDATINDLRTKLEQKKDEQSCCGSCTGGEETEAKKRWMCRNCGEEQSRVLIVPCRHLCLCEVCGTSPDMCPFCNSPRNA